MYIIRETPQQQKCALWTIGGTHIPCEPMPIFGKLKRTHSGTTHELPIYYR